MAVEKARVVARIKELFPKLNLSQKRMDALADKLAQKPADDAEDAAVDEAVNSFNEVMPFTEIAKTDDRNRQFELEKAKKLKTKTGKKQGTADPDEDDEDDDPDEFDADTPKWARAMAKNLGGLSQKMSDFEAGKQTETKRTTANKAFEKSEVLKGLKPQTKERWLSRINLDSDETFDTQITDLEAEYSELVQQNADKVDVGGQAGNGKPAKVSQEEVDGVIDGMKV